MENQNQNAIVLPRNERQGPHGINEPVPVRNQLSEKEKKRIDEQTEKTRAHYGEEPGFRIHRTPTIRTEHVNDIPTPNNLTRDVQIRRNNLGHDPETTFGRSM